MNNRPLTQPVEAHPANGSEVKAGRTMVSPVPGLIEQVEVEHVHGFAEVHVTVWHRDRMLTLAMDPAHLVELEPETAWTRLTTDTCPKCSGEGRMIDFHGYRCGNCDGMGRVTVKVRK